MAEETTVSKQREDELTGWTNIAVAAGLLACFSYPLMVYVPLPRLAQVTMGATFGPSLAVASVALARVLQERRRAPSIELAAILNSLAGALVTAMIIVQLAINYSTAPAADEQLTDLLTRRIWDVVLGLDVAFDVFIGLATLLFALNMLGDPRFGKVIGWAGASISVFLLLGANFYFFPDPPRQHGFPEIGIFVGLWYLAVVLLIVRSVRKGRAGAAVKRGR
ncbi:MAG: hypothetical protein A2Z37_03060 [Chloroflexi bacterium RBG_19FT_COMBO_62_14]|nr:MAG: hypothetical protein A2Z37_03060 [Chloroflexi bacterium RBG_19FT_COMBO_62_14]